MERYNALNSGNRVDATLLSSSSADVPDAQQNAVCWRGKSINHSHTDQTILKDKVGDVFSRMTLWTPPQASASHHQNDHDLLQHKDVSFPSQRAMPYLFTNSETDYGLWVPDPEKMFQPEPPHQTTPVATRPESRQEKGEVTVQNPMLNFTQVSLQPRRINGNNSENAFSPPKNEQLQEGAIPADQYLLRKAESKDEIFNKLCRLRGETITADLWKIETTGEGMSGTACYKLDDSTQLLVVFTIPRNSNNRENTMDKPRVVQGTLGFESQELKTFLENNDTEILQKAYYQKTGSSPFYFSPDTIRLLGHSNKLPKEKAYIFNHIKSLAGKIITAEIMKVNFARTIGVAWYDFSTNDKIFGTPVAFKVSRLPDYRNRGGEKLTIESSPPAYRVKGRVQVDKARLYHSVFNYCPPQFITKSVDTCDGLPVFLVKNSIEIMHSRPYDKVTIEHKKKCTVMRYSLE